LRYNKEKIGEKIVMKNILEQATNKINIVGKLLDTTFNHGVTKTGAPYERANLTIRVTQTYNG
jgi:hypothetical protein